MAKTIFFLVEEESMQHILEVIVPKIINEQDEFKIFTHQGKQDLKKQLSEKVPILLKNPNSYVLILQDQDSNDCKKLKKELNDLIKDKCDNQKYKIRIVCRQLENWYFGDFEAIQSAFNNVKREKFENKAIFRNVDILENAPKELVKIIPQYKPLKTLPKIGVAKKIAPHLEISKNKNKSFEQFVKGLKNIVSG